MIARRKGEALRSKAKKGNGIAKRRIVKQGQSKGRRSREWKCDGIAKHRLVKQGQSEAEISNDLQGRRPAKTSKGIAL